MDGLLRKIERDLGRVSAIMYILHKDQIEEFKTQVLGDGTKASVYAACDGKTTVTQIAQDLGVSQPTVSKHLRSLSDYGLVGQVEVDGQQFYEQRL